MWMFWSYHKAGGECDSCSKEQILESPFSYPSISNYNIKPMLELSLATLIWGFSFGLIKSSLAGVDPHFVSWVRIFLGFIAFIPFLKWKGMDFKVGLKIAGIGLIQLGWMYYTYHQAFAYLKGYEVALFTVTTPVYVAVIEQVLRKNIKPMSWVFVFLALLGAAWIQYKGIQSEAYWKGFLLIQSSNLCFSLGQCLYRSLRIQNPELKDHECFALLYGGALLFLTGVVLAHSVSSDVTQLSTGQVGALIYLGLIPSGLGYFLWNKGALSVNGATLAIFNNMKIPVAILISVFVFRESADWLQIGIGSCLIFFALLFSEKTTQGPSPVK